MARRKRFKCPICQEWKPVKWFCEYHIIYYPEARTIRACFRCNWLEHRLRRKLLSDDYIRANNLWYVIERINKLRRDVLFEFGITQEPIKKYRT